MEEFLKKFDTKIENVKIVGRRYYQVNKELDKINKEINRNPDYIGTFLGEKKKYFIPSLALLEMIKTDKKAIISGKAEWMFLCGKDVFVENAEGIQEGTVLVYNEHNDNLGLGKWERSQRKKILKNIVDRGDFLRREG